MAGSKKRSQRSISLRELDRQLTEFAAHEEPVDTQVLDELEDRLAERIKNEYAPWRQNQSQVKTPEPQLEGRAQRVGSLALLLALGAVAWVLLSPQMAGLRQALTQPGAPGGRLADRASGGLLADGTHESAGHLSWGEGPGMLQARAEHSQITLEGGEILIAGGQASGQSSASSTSELFVPEEARWVARPGLIEARSRFGSLEALPDGSALVAGGVDREERSVLASSERFVPGRRMWVATSPLSFARADAALSQLRDGSVLVSGGYADVNGTEFVHAAETYDAAAGSWVEAGSPSIGRSEHLQVTLADGRAVVLGGVSEDAPAERRIEVFQPETRAWSFGGSLVNGRVGAAALFLPDGRVLVTGGDNGVQGQARIEYAAAEIYDPSTQKSDPIAPMKRPRVGHTLHLLTDGRVVAIGGDPSQDSGATTEVYDVGTDAWHSGPELPTASSGFGVSALSDGRLVVSGGWRTRAGTEQAPTARTARLQW